MKKRLRCNLCGKKFATSDGVTNHSNMVHGGNGRAIPLAERDDDESFAERAVQAEIDIASGKGSDDAWLLP